ncbi:O-antigen ligase domain-containing protein [Candidatus Parcubacteria bacterium]|nr:MAG: O-antigen ligase domain-containing protein [Candidatus Parcubacteria bacterium]
MQKDLKKTELFLQFVFYFFGFVLPWQTRWIIQSGALGEYTTISLYASDIILLLLLALALPRIIKKFTPSAPIPIYWWILAGFEFFVFISFWMASDKMLALQAYGRLLLGFGLFWLMGQCLVEQSKFLFFLLLSILGQALLAIWQFLAQKTFAFKWLGVAAHSTAQGGTAVVESLGAERWLRAYGGMGHPNILGGMLAIAIVLLVFWFWRLREPDFRHKIFYWFALVAYLAALFFSFSRSGWLMLVVGAFIFSSNWLFVRPIARYPSWITATGVAMLAVIVLLVGFYGDLVKVRFLAQGRLENKSIVERIQSLRSALGVIKDNFWGVGVGNYVFFNASNDINLAIHYPQPVHNGFLLMGAEVGVGGAIIFIWLLINIAKKIWFLRKDDFIGYLEGIILLAMLVVGWSLDHYWWSLHFGILWFWLILGLIKGIGVCKNRTKIEMIVDLSLIHI